jgi:hypothetical protein
MAYRRHRIHGSHRSGMAVVASATIHCWPQRCRGVRTVILSRLTSIRMRSRVISSIIPASNAIQPWGFAEFQWGMMMGTTEGTTGRKVSECVHARTESR